MPNSAQGAGSGIACMKTDLLFDPPTSIDKESSREIGVSVDPSSVVGHLQFEAVDVKIAWYVASVGKLLESNVQT